MQHRIVGRADIVLVIQWMRSVDCRLAVHKPKGNFGLGVATSAGAEVQPGESTGQAELRGIGSEQAPISNIKYNINIVTSLIAP